MPAFFLFPLYSSPFFCLHLFFENCRIYLFSFISLLFILTNNFFSRQMQLPSTSKCSQNSLKTEKRQKHSAPTGNTMVVKKLIRQPRQDQQLVEAWESCQNTVTVCRNFHFLSCIFHFNLITGEIIIPFACNGESNGICSIGLAEVSGN